MYQVPLLQECMEFAKAMGCTRIEEVEVSPIEGNRQFECHYNSKYNPVLGYYFVKDSHNILHAFKHSVTDCGDRLIDTTPSNSYIVFGYGTSYVDEHLSYVDNSVYINKNKQEGETDMYYVYGLIDPRNNEVFYIGKGRDNRWLSHFNESALSKSGNNRKTAKIKKLKSLGFDPMVEFYAQNIEDEQLAYDIEAALIQKYGRIDCEDKGILTNICTDNRPPNFKGKTYAEIMGKTKAKHLIEHKRNLQLLAGGYGPEKHSNETKTKISKASSGIKNGNSSGLNESDILNIGKKIYSTFNGELTNKKWEWYCNKHNIPINITKTFRFNGEHIFKVFERELGMKVHNKEKGLRWLHSDENKIRMYDWQIKIEGIPEGYRLGRGKI